MKQVPQEKETYRCPISPHHRTGRKRRDRCDIRINWTIEVGYLYEWASKICLTEFMLILVCVIRLQITQTA